jgi:selenocysteine lyase/cysteine desulfurase
MNSQQLRLETPGCKERIHLNNAGAALMPEPVVRAMQDYITLESQMGGYEAAAAQSETIEAAYQSVGKLIGAEARNIAFTENATVSFAQALSAIPFKPDDAILTTRNDYASNQIQFLSLHNRLGVCVLRGRDQLEGGVDVNEMAELIRRHRPKFVCATQIPTNSGLVQDVRAIGNVCHEEGVIYLVDACQSVGQMPINVQDLKCDFLSASSRKFLRGPRGAGFLYVSDRVLEMGLQPLFIDMRGADWVSEDSYRAVGDAKRFENWEFAWSLVLGTGAAARYATAIGLELIQERARSLAVRLRQALGEIGQVKVLDKGRELGAIVSVAVEGHDPAALVKALRERRINTSSQIREYAVIDYDAKGVNAALRISPHYYNTEDEIDQAVAALRELLSEKRR